MGWGSSLQKNETTFLILDGGMILASVLLLTIFHPAIFFPYMGKHYTAAQSQPAFVPGQAADSEVMTERKH